MSEINIVDCTFRDAHQSLWGDKMNTAMMGHIAPVMNRAGFKAMDITGTGHFTYAIRFLRENPWERLELLKKLIPDTPLSLMMLGTNLNLFTFTRGPVFKIWMERLAAHGIRRVQIMEASNNMDDIAETVRAAKEAGLEAVVPLVFSHSPVHTDDYYAQRTRDAVQLGSDIIYLKDSGGLLTPERTRTLIPRMQENLGDLPFEFHSHCTTGLAPLCYLEAARLGVRTFHTAISPLANGSSLPCTRNLVRNARHLGFSSGVSEEALETISQHFREVAEVEGFPMGAPLEYDYAQYRHQVPGGVISNLRRQLSELKLESRLEEVLEETIRVREELGYPIMVTPLSQFVVTQASLNVTQGERYKVIADQVILFALGHYGKQPVPIQDDVLDRIHSSPRTKEFLGWSPPETSIESLRRDFGTRHSVDDLLLIMLSSEEDLRLTQAAGPCNTQYRGKGNPLVSFLKDVVDRRGKTYVFIQKGDMSLTLS